MAEITYCKIFPSIGVARIGDSESEWFLGPESLDDTARSRGRDFSFRDADGRIKRQAARFRIYGFDKEGKVVREITEDEAKITWNVSLANKKAAWFEFRGTEKALKAYRGSEGAPNPRNPEIGKLILREEAGRCWYEPDEDRKEMLEILGGTYEISGKCRRTVDNDLAEQYRFKGFFKKAVPVELGELRTDEAGRLLVLGGHGHSDAVDGTGASIRSLRWIRNYANNNDWYDDTSDGPVTATVVLRSSEKEIQVRDGAWVIVGPPDFAPDVANIVTLYDVMEEVALNNAGLVGPDTPQPRKPGSVSFYADIVPILQRMHNYRWVNAMGLRGHGFGKPGDFQKAGKLGELTPDLSDRKSPSGRLLRERIFSMLRRPAYQRGPDHHARYDSPEAISQASTVYMPPLAGDEGDPEPGKPDTWLTLTYLQYERMEAWSRGEFTVQDNIGRGRPNEEPLDPGALTHAALICCAGGAFYPGIEMTCIAREPSLYVEAFRFNHATLRAGDVTKFMALPWQADFWECQVHWWPAQRPDDIVTTEEFETVLSQFKEEASGAFAQQFDRVLFNRDRWDRGIGRRSRPTAEYLMARILPEPRNGETAENYINLVCAISLSKDNPEWLRFTQIDSLASIFVRLAGVSDFTDLAVEPWPAGQSGERLPSPWRLQYTSQEALDAYSGLYFHLSVPAPEEALKKKSNLPEIRKRWNALRIEEPQNAASILGNYATAVRDALIGQIKQALVELPLDHGDAKDLQSTLNDGVIDDLERENPQDFSPDDPIYKELRALEMVQQARDALYIRATNWAGDMDMVNDWHKHGFVVEEQVVVPVKHKQPSTLICQVETSRAKYDGRSFRDYFYFLMNLQEYPDFEPYAKQIALDILASAQKLIDKTGIFDTNHPESFVEYSRISFAAKLEEIYEILRSQAFTALGWRTDRTRQDWVRAILDSAPFNQMDGTWLRFVENAGPSDQVRSLLFEVWSDEVGNGDPSLHHGNLFTTLISSLGTQLPPVASRAYADNPDIDESNFIDAVFELAISLHSESFLPEILGMTLLLEWEVLSLVPGIKGREYIGIDPEFWRMHVGIDNASEGHGAKARAAVELYLDEVLKKSGVVAMQEEWKRVWRGFVAFATAGYDYFGNMDNQNDLTLSRAHPPSPQNQIQQLMQVKEHYGSLNHLQKRLGAHRLNDLFAKPDIFAQELANSAWIVPGDPDNSQLLKYLTTFNGPMYKVFTKDQLALWRKWIQWLGFEGDTARSKHYLTKAESMLMLLSELRELAKGVDGHRRYSLTVKSPPHDKRLAIADLFAKGDLKELMHALADPNNGWMVPFDPGSSPFVLDLARGDRPMGQMLDRRFPALANQIGRKVVIRWIEAGCPIPGEPAPPVSKLRIERRWEGKRLFVQQLGMGAVH